MDSAEGVIEAKWTARQGGSGRGCYRAASLEPTMVAKGDEHVLALDAPTWGKRPFDSATQCPRDGSVCAQSRNEPIAASRGSVLACVDDRSPSRNESGAALDVEECAIPRLSHPAGHHAVPIADLRASQHVEGPLCAHKGAGIEGPTTQTHVASFAFNAEHEGRAN
jgi:hypothetical protein